MSCGYHINLEDGLTTISANAADAEDKLLALGQQIIADPEFDPKLPQLVDLRGLQMSAERTSTNALRDFTLTTYRPSVQASIAIVVNESLDEKSLAGLYHLSCAMDKTELFDHYDQALKWLMRREFA